MLTPAQLAALKADIQADGVLNAFPNNSDGNYEIAAAYNILDGAFYGWRPTTPTQTLFDSIAWANMTPLDAPDSTQQWMNRSLACQGKQFNVQTMLAGREVINSGKSNIRAGLQDALTNIPSAAGGATQAANWVAVRDSMKRLLTRAEKLFASGGNGAFATPADLNFEGSLTYYDVGQARSS